MRDRGTAHIRTWRTASLVVATPLLVTAIIHQGVAAVGANGSPSASPQGDRRPPTLEARESARWCESSSAAASTPSESPGPSLEPSRQEGVWRRLADAPIAGRTGHSAVWTGDEVIVWGGRPEPSARGSVRFRPEGAAYDPERDRWRRLESAPIRGRAGHTAAWTGDEMIVWGGHDRSGQPLIDGAAYDPITDSWRAIASADAAVTPLADVLWIGSTMVVWGYVGAREDAELVALSYDPANDRWDDLPASGLPVGHDQTSVWTGTVMVTVAYPTGGRNAAMAAYDPVLDTWQPLATPLYAAYDPKAIWTGREIVLLGIGGPPLRDRTTSATYDVAGGCWMVPTLPSFLVWGEPVWSGELVYFVGGSYDPRTDSWLRAPRWPRTMRREFPTATWAGDRVVYWGGRDFGGGLRPELDSGFMYIPLPRRP